MIAIKPDERPPTKTECAKILADTVQAVRVMKASWLHVAINLKKIRDHELWRQTTPPCNSYEEYAFDVLKLNRYVAKRMLEAMEYTREHRPEVVARFEKGDEEVEAEVPSYDVVNQLRRVEQSFGDRSNELAELRSRVFDDGVGRVVLKREIDSKLGKMSTGTRMAASGAAKPAAQSLEAIIEDLMAIEKRLRELKISKETQKIAFQLVEALQKEKGRARSPGGRSSV